MATSEEHGAPRGAAEGNRPDWAIITPDARMRPLFDVVDEVIVAAEQAVEAVADTEDHFVRSDSYVLARGINGVKSARLLISAGHWEHATALARQLFELLVNMEHFGSFGDRVEAQKLYTGFGLLQFFLAEFRRIEFEKGRGRPGGSPWELSVKDYLENHCAEFKLPPRADGVVRWRSSWSGKTIRALAESSPDPMRVPQYELLFSAWSEQTHATPGVFANDLFLQYEEEVIAEALAEIEGIPPEFIPPIGGAARREVQTLSMATVLFMQLWQQLPNVNQPGSRWPDWLERIKDFAGGKGLPIAE
ncbi:DUF5677 domain-containing protein [Streptomyces sp. NPDC001508]|uniref:DUF5677 domain-containing protein n=1 Tax=Streptomyces sp. NPDC001508 TaxID=3154656 RepID=UPI0033211988